MARRTSKDKQVLERAQARMDDARLRADDLQQQSAIASAEWRAYAATFYELQKELTPQPRQPATKPARGTSRAPKDSLSRGRDQCAHEYPDNRFCRQPDTDPIHAEDSDDVFAHAFIASGARRKSSPKKHARLSASSSEDLMDRRPAPDEICTYISDDGRGNGAECRSVQADPIHDKSMGYGGYHPFQPLPSAAHGASGD